MPSEGSSPGRACNGPQQTCSAWAGRGPSLSNLHSWRTGAPLAKPVAAPLAFAVVLEVLLRPHVTQGATAVSLNALGELCGHTSKGPASSSPHPPAHGAQNHRSSFRSWNPVSPVLLEAFVHGPSGVTISSVGDSHQAPAHTLPPREGLPPPTSSCSVTPSQDLVSSLKMLPTVSLVLSAPGGPKSEP